MHVLEGLIHAARRRAADIVLPGTVRPDRPGFQAALCGRQTLSLIAEFKRRSPSLGPIAPDIDVISRVRSYAEHGAAAISVLTEPEHFGGSYDDLRAAASAVQLPILMKDFVVHPIQVQLAARIGASAVLLIVRCLAAQELRDLVAATASEGLDALVECHSEADVDRALDAGATILGINNRDLDTLRIDRATARALAPYVPQDCVAVAESGYDTPEALAEIRGLTDAVLVGTALMRGASIHRFAGASVCGDEPT